MTAKQFLIKHDVIKKSGDYYAINNSMMDNMVIKRILAAMDEYAELKMDRLIDETIDDRDAQINIDHG